MHLHPLEKNTINAMIRVAIKRSLQFVPDMFVAFGDFVCFCLVFVCVVFASCVVFCFVLGGENTTIWFGKQIIAFLPNMCCIFPTGVHPTCTV